MSDTKAVHKTKPTLPDVSDIPSLVQDRWTGEVYTDRGHRCAPPLIASITAPLQPDWQCATCGRIWRDVCGGVVRWWAEVRGPRHDA